MEFPKFYGKDGESGQDFLDSFELSCVLAGKDDPTFLAKLFPLALRSEAREWYNGINKSTKEDWIALKEAFLNAFSPKKTLGELWEELQQLRQDTLSAYDVYESSFLSLLTQLKEALKGCDFLPNSLVKDIFMNGLFCTLQSKVYCKFPNTFHDALQIAREKHRRMMYLTQGSSYVPKVSTSQIEYLDYFQGVDATHNPLSRSFGAGAHCSKDNLPCVQPRGPYTTFSSLSSSLILPPPQVEEEDCIKEVIFEVEDVAAARKEEERRHLKIEEKDTITAVAVDGDVKDWQVIQNEEDGDLFNGGDKEREDEISKKTHPQEAPTKEEEVWQEPQASSCFVQDAPNLESRGEGWLPFPKNSLTNAMFFYDESDEDASHLYEELLCSQSSIDAASEKIEVTSYSSDKEEILGQSLFGFGDDLEMVNASNSTWKDSEGLEMCDSSCPVVVHEDFAGLWDNMSPAVNKFLQGCIITCYALQSLSLYGLKQEEPESQIKEEGEGWMPILGDEQVKNGNFKCTAIAKDEVYPDEEWFCEQSSIYATKEVKLEEMQVPTSKQSLVCSEDDLEMVDASNSRRKIGEGLEMCDSSRPSLVSNAFAMSWDSKSVQAILLHEAITISETIGERDLATINKEAIKEEKDDWGFDEPICIMDAAIQANVDKAMERIAASRPTKLDTLWSAK